MWPPNKNGDKTPLDRQHFGNFKRMKKLPKFIELGSNRIN